MSESLEQTWQDALKSMDDWLHIANIDLDQREAINCCEDQSKVLEWSLCINKTELSVTLIQTPSDVRLQIFAPLVTLSPEHKQAATFETLLRLNASTLSGCAFGLEEDTIMVLTDRSARALHVNDLGDAIANVERIAQLHHLESKEVPDHLAEIYQLCRANASDRL